MPKVFLNSGSSSPQGLPTKMRLNISSNSRRTPNRSSNSLSVVYRCFISSSSIEFRLTRGGPFTGFEAAASAKAFSGLIGRRAVNCWRFRVDFAPHRCLGAKDRRSAKSSLFVQRDDLPARQSHRLCRFSTFPAASPARFHGSLYPFALPFYPHRQYEISDQRHASM